VSRNLGTAAAIALIALSAILTAHPFASAQVQAHAGVTEEEFTNMLPAGGFNSTAITVTAPSIIEYSTDSNVTIYTAFMDQQEVSAFRQPGDIANSIFYQQGTVNYDALLEGPGTYYLVEYAESGPANVTGIYVINADVDLRNSTTSVGELVTIQPGVTVTLPLHVETLGSSSEVDVLGASTRVLQYSILDRTTNTVVFTSPHVTITNFTITPRVSAGYNITLGPGLYVLGVTDESPDAAYAYIEYTIIPAHVNPFLLNFGPPSPTGIAAYGLYNRSGVVTPYEVESSSIVGYADINALQATGNESDDHQASLQENTLLEVNNTDGSVYTYWPQNVLAFDTGASIVTYRDNILNTTGDGAQLDNQTIHGTGTTSVDDSRGVNQTYYGNYDSNYTYRYTLPQAWVLYTNETVERGTGVIIQMGVSAIQGTSPYEVTWFDRITIDDPEVASADLVVNGREYTPAGSDSPIGSFFDAELVFGGGAGGQAATYNLNADLALFYWDQTIKAFPSLYTFGVNTAESAYNIRVTYGDGVAEAASGTPYYGILTNDFNSSLAALVAHARVQQPAGPSYAGYLAAGLVITAVLVIAFAVVLRRRRAPVTVLETPYSPQPATRFCGSCGSPIHPDARFCPNCGAEQMPEAAGDGPPGGNEHPTEIQ
jgi:thermopsin